MEEKKTTIINNLKFVNHNEWSALKQTIFVFVEFEFFSKVFYILIETNKNYELQIFSII